jgi:hypothetical protein
VYIRPPATRYLKRCAMKPIQYRAEKSAAARSGKPNGIIEVATGIRESWRTKLIRDGGSACSCREDEISGCSGHRPRCRQFPHRPRLTLRRLARRHPLPMPHATAPEPLPCTVTHRSRAACERATARAAV